MAVITLTTEWKQYDFYGGIIKGKLCCMCPGVMIVDNATGIPAFNISHASFVIRNTYSHYPPGSVHIICVHSEGNKDRRHLAVRCDNHYFIGTDNGIFNLILNREPDEAVIINNDGNNDETDIFASAATNLIRGKSLKEIGQPAVNITEKIPLRATIEKDVITGSVIFIDSYGNAISNITREVFYRVFPGHKFRILIQSNRNCITHISQGYSEEPVGEMLARFNILDLLEVAINGADISELFNLSTGSVIRVEMVHEEKIFKQ